MALGDHAGEPVKDTTQQATASTRMTPHKEPKFSDFYQPTEQQKNGELLFVGAWALALS